MAVTRQHLENALQIAAEEVCDDDDIRKHEIKEIKKRFNNLLDLLAQEANEEPDDDR